MDNKIMEKTIETLGNVTKVAANLSEVKKEPVRIRPLNSSSDDSNNASTGSQNIQIHMDTGKKREPKPVEKHIHEFPEQRPLTEEECKLALEKARMNYELEKTAQDHFIMSDNRAWQHKLELEAKNEKKQRRFGIFAGILCALGIAAAGYSVYTDCRNNRGVRAANPNPAENPINGEGNVK